MGAKNTGPNEAPGATGIGKRVAGIVQKTFDYVDSTSLGKYVDRTSRKNKGSKQ